MQLFWITCAVLTTAASLAAALFFRRREKQTMRKIGQMLDSAMSGDFQEADFDESLLSSLESRLAAYLSASVASARNLDAEKEKIKTLIADISHQTKTPLSNILLYAQLLAEQNLSAQSSAYTDTLQQQTKKLEFLIVSLIKISRLETGILVMHPKQAAVLPVLRRAVDAFSHKALEKNITLSLESVSVTAVFDPKWTEEALCNLLDNAVKYTPCGGAVRLRAIQYEMFCRIDVIDNGIGIPESAQAKIFTRFYRADAANEQQGVGIGLYLARKIAAEQGGYIKVSSAEGEGAMFSLFLPAG